MNGFLNLKLVKMNLSQKIAIVDYGIGNIYSITNAIHFLGYNNLILTDKQKELNDADVLLLPGVGAFDEAMRTMKKKKLDLVLGEIVLVQKKPILGICVGMQMLSKGSYENGWNEGLNWIDGIVKKLEIPFELTVPHVGWNNIKIKNDSSIFNNFKNESPHFYFDHSFHLDTNPENVSATCSYGINIVSSVQKDNIFGVQFHPEKSQRNGLKLFRSFFNSI